MTTEQKEWIDNASYEQLLTRWRFSSSVYGDTIFQGEAGSYYTKAMKRKQEEIGDYEASMISKKVGW